MPVPVPKDHKGNPEWIDLWFDGQIPSKSNYHHNRESRRTNRWGRIKDAERLIGEAALRAWKEAGGKGGAKGMLEHADGKDVMVAVICHRQRIDPNNAPKLVCDALEWVCYENDKDVEARSKNSREPRLEAGAQIRVWWRPR